MTGYSYVCENICNCPAHLISRPQLEKSCQAIISAAAGSDSTQKSGLARPLIIKNTAPGIFPVGPNDVSEYLFPDIVQPNSPTPAIR
jgi:hypothetical protein